MFAQGKKNVEAQRQRNISSALASQLIAIDRKV